MADGRWQMANEPMHRDLKSELRVILEAITIEPPLAFTFAGRRIQVDPAAPYSMPQVPGVQNPLIASLQMQIYQHCYCRRFDGSAVEAPVSSDGGEDLTGDLTQANVGQERWEPGWQVTQFLSSGELAVQRNGLNRLLWPGDYLTPDGPGGMPRKGSYVSVFCRKHSTSLQPGFYFVFGETLGDQQDESSPLRFYWHVAAAGITALVGGLTRELNRFPVPFRFKCLTRSALYARADAAVLFVARRMYPVVAGLVEDTYHRVAPQLRADAPLFAKPLAPGLALAEDPGNGESFGSHRCRLVAEALVNAETHGRRTPEARLEEVEKLFHEHGLSLESPHLSRGSIDCYQWPVPELFLQ